MEQAVVQKRHYDLEERTKAFAKAVREFVKQVPYTLLTVDDCKQLLRSSGSIGANYIEANESLGKRNFLMHVKISRKEAKETCYWLELLDLHNSSLDRVRCELLDEARQFERILGAIFRRSQASM